MDSRDKKNATKGRPDYLKPVHESFETNYAYQVKVFITDRHEESSRKATRARIQNVLRQTDVRDCKIIENADNFLICFKRDYDYRHFMIAHENGLNTAGKNSFLFNLPEKSGSDGPNSWELAMHFKQAVDAAGLDEAIRITAAPDKKSLSVHTRTLDEYFQFWRHVPEDTRLRISSYSV